MGGGGGGSPLRETRIQWVFLPGPCAHGLDIPGRERQREPDREGESKTEVEGNGKGDRGR